MNQFTSGDVLADRRAGYARMLSESGAFQEAAELMTQALEIISGWAAGWFQLADYEEKSGRIEAAIAALRQAIKLDPEDVFGAGLKLAVLGATEAPRTPPSRYVERLFDDYAGRFEKALVEKLQYSVPEKLLALIQSQVGGDYRFSRVTDLGCGTGLFGERIRPQAGVLEGFDLSLNMLAKAREKAIYDALGHADLSLAPEASGLFSADNPVQRSDLVAAADVLIYLGDLSAVFTIAATLTAPGGFLAFSVEEAGPADDFVLRHSLRYAHSPDHAGGLCFSHGFDMLKTERTTIRFDAGTPVSGVLFLARKRP